MDAVCDRPELAPLLTPSSIKRQLQFHDVFQNRLIPLGQLFVLGLDNAIAIVPLSIQDTIQYLIANTYVARFKDELLRGESAQHHLQQLTRLASQVPVHRLLRPIDLTLLSHVAEQVESHVRSPEPFQTLS